MPSTLSCNTHLRKDLQLKCVQEYRLQRNKKEGKQDSNLHAIQQSAGRCCIISDANRLIQFTPDGEG